MLIKCPYCQSKAIISSNKSLTDTGTVKDLYCVCKDAENCGATFVFTLSYKHTRNPPHQTTLQIAAALIKSLPAKDQRALLQQADMFG